MKRASGILLVAQPTGRALLLKRAADGWWSLPGGMLEQAETPAAGAARELLEETGYRGELMGFQLLHVHRDSRFAFYTYQALVPREFRPRLDHEHTAWGWYPRSRPPRPLHPGLVDAIGER